MSCALFYLSYILIRTELISGLSYSAPRPFTIILFMSLISWIIGSILSFFTYKIPLKPINTMIEKMNQLASGNFKVRLKFDGLLKSYPAYKGLRDSFNKMAEELEKTEVLRSDFINNFSHEFKTPIVSIAGFAKVLKRGNLTEEQRAEYIDIIEEESLGLSYMATNVLNFTKVENQTILTDASYFNLSEQIRSSVLLLEKKWLEKNLELGLEFSEYTITANEELLKQVLINLIDNAVKFTPYGGMIDVKIVGDDDYITVEITNTDSEISLTSRTKYLIKFYQADESHSSKGNGIGLAIVKRSVELHKGEVSVKSKNGVTTFKVELPVNQN